MPNYEYIGLFKQSLGDSVKIEVYESIEYKFWINHFR